MKHESFRKPYRAVPLRHTKTGKVIPFARPRRRSRKLRLSPILIMAPLAILTVLLLRQVPEGFAYITPASTSQDRMAPRLDPCWSVNGDDCVSHSKSRIAPGRPDRLADIDPPAQAEQDGEAVRFGMCWGRSGDNCVIDGDSLIYAGRQIRIADIDAPEMGHPRCTHERELAEAAEDRLQDLLNAGPFSLEPVERATDRYGRDLFVVTREGKSLGDTLIAEGLAHRWVGHKLPWCTGEAGWE